MKRMYRLLILAWMGSLLLYSHTTFSQRVEARNALYLEMGGNAYIYSLNYERIFLPEKYIKVGARAGISLLPKNNLTAPYPIVPLEVLAFTGKRNHHFETGIGLTPFVGYVTYAGARGSDYERERLQAATTFRLGYRYQKPEGGFMLRAGYMPILNPDGYMIFWAGISIGKSF
ncbi:hypothetical protein Q0590_18435 [Rhodocytophaga aerolata]|uniref:DUF3575 domain-containing protein n=1 Tax=Rhodocytophaga aerolata TaxID=455078 RepID=A0ABT8R837_9BACT|nr:hypothetical protein [Rhodocytophaga aerolata]MDO1448259.1 hypothetical protein [Rhodocytophaga aerolata]